jgi:drug/metabolite transporter (DMT)-like permease
MSSALQMLFASVVLIPAGFLAGERPAWPWPSESLGAFVYLIMFGSLVGFVAYVYMLEHLPAAVVGSYTYVNPLVAVWVGWFFLGESVSSRFWLAGLLVLAGLYLVNRTSGKKGVIREL